MAGATFFGYNRAMTRLGAYLDNVSFHDEHFIGTIAFRNEELTLADGSKLALGIDDGHWVLVYQKAAGAPFQVYEYNKQLNKIVLDKKPGGPDELRTFKSLLANFFAQTSVEDLVTILPTGGPVK